MKRTKPPEERRHDIISAAIRVLGQVGVQNATFAKIASESGVAVGTISFHFHSKDNLLKAVAESLLEDQECFWRKALSEQKLCAAERILITCEAGFFPPDADQYLELSAWFALDADLDWRLKKWDISRNFERARLEELEAAISIVREEGRYQLLEPRPVATSLLALSQGLALSHLVAHPPKDAQDRRMRISLLVALKVIFPKHFDSFGAIL